MFPNPKDACIKYVGAKFQRKKVYRGSGMVMVNKYMQKKKSKLWYFFLKRRVFQTCLLYLQWKEKIKDKYSSVMVPCRNLPVYIYSQLGQSLF